MNVRELRELLGDFGDPIEVVIFDANGDVVDFTVGSGYVDNRICVILDTSE